MSRRYVALASSLTICVLLVTAAAARQPRVINARLTPQSAATLSQTFRSLVGAQTEVAWIGYAVPVKDRHRSTCCWTSGDGSTHVSGSMSSGEVPCCGGCRLEPGASGSGSASGSQSARVPGAVKLEGAERMVVLFRVVDRQVERVRTFSEDCELDAGGRQVHWLQDVRPADSVALLGSLIAAESTRKSRVTNAALMALSQHAEPSAPAAITRLAREHTAAAVRGEALFWLAQMAGQKVAGTIAAAIDNDPDTEVKRRAVFALSQLPKDEGVPLLIDVARKNTNAAVRKQAMFWLGQSRDARAIEFFAEILK
jgi:hypothetical protein